MLELRKEKKGGSSSPTKDMEKVLSSLANRDALEIFHEAKDGITNSTETIGKLGLTQKRYYARLKPLIGTGLIQKTEKGYNLTFLGKIIYEILYRKLGKTLESKDRIALIDKLNKAESLSKEEKEQISAAISVKDKIVGYSGLFGEIKPVEIFYTFEELRNTLSRIVDKSEKELLIATRYTDSLAAEAFLRTARRGVKLRLIDGDKNNLSDRVNILRTLLFSPRTLKTFYDVLNSPQTSLKFTDLPYSFFVIDRRYVGIEVVNPLIDDFFLGFIFDDEKLSEKFAEFFEALSQKASGNHPFKFLSVNLKGHKSGTSPVINLNVGS